MMLSDFFRELREKKKRSENACEAAGGTGLG